MANPFDQFDEDGDVAVMDAPKGNPFDQFDEPVAKKAALQQEEPAQPLPESAWNTIKQGFVDVAAKPLQALGNWQKNFNEATGIPILPLYDLRGAGEFAGEVSEQSKAIRPIDPRNKITNTVAGAIPQAMAMISTGGVLGAPAALGLGGLMGAQQGFETADEIGVTSPLGKLATAAAFGATEAAVERLGGIGAKDVVGSAAKRFLTGLGSEAIEEPITGAAQDLVTRVAATDTGNGQTATGYDLSQLSPTDPRYWEKRGLETLGGAAGGTVFAGVQALSDLAQPKQASVQQEVPQGPDDIDAEMQRIREAEQQVPEPVGTSIEDGQSIVPDLSAVEPPVPPPESVIPVVDQAALDAQAAERQARIDEMLTAIDEKRQAQIEALPDEKLDDLIRKAQLSTNAAAVANDPSAEDEQEWLDRLRAEKVRRNPPPSQQVADAVATVDLVAAETGIQVAQATLAAVDEASKILETVSEPAAVLPAAPTAAPAQEPSPPAAGAAFTSRNAEMLPDTDTFGGKFDEPLNINPNSYVNKDGIETVEYTNPRTGDVDVYISAFGDKDFIAYMRQYDENGNPTNRWTSKLERRTKRAGATKAMMQELQSRLPAGHQYTEDSSVSTDGLRFISGQLRQGYVVATNPDGSPQTSEVAISGESITNDLPVAVDPNGKFENIRITSPAEFAKVKKYLGKMLESFGVGLNENNVRWENGTAFIDLPVLQSTTRPSSQTRDYEPGSEDPKEIPPQTPEEQPSTEQKPGGKQSTVEALKQAVEMVGRDELNRRAEVIFNENPAEDGLTTTEVKALAMEEAARLTASGNWTEEPSKKDLTDEASRVKGGGMETTTEEPDYADLHSYIEANHPQEAAASRYLDPLAQYKFHLAVWRSAGSPKIDTEDAPPATQRDATKPEQTKTVSFTVLRENIPGEKPKKVTVKIPVTIENGVEVLTPEAHKIIDDAKWPDTPASPFHASYAEMDYEQYFAVWGDESNRDQVRANYRKLMERAASSKKPFSYDGWKFDMREPVPTGYQKQGDLYVFQPETTQPQTPTPQPPQASAVQAAAETGVQEARSEEGAVSITQDEISDKIEETLRAPTQATKKPRVSFKTQAEEGGFRRGFQAAVQKPGEPPPPDKPGLSPKDRKYDDAWRVGWSHGQMFVRSYSQPSKSNRLPAPSAPSRESEAGAVATSPPGASPPVVAASKSETPKPKKATGKKEAPAQQEKPSPKGEQAKPPDTKTPRTIAPGDSIKFKTEGLIHSGKFLGITKDGKGYMVVKGNGERTTVLAHQINGHNGDAMLEGTRFSMPKSSVTPEQDAEYLAAVASGDVAKQQALVDAAAKAAGGVRVYQVVKGGRIKGDKFDPKFIGSRNSSSLSQIGYMFTSNEESANDYVGSPFEGNKVKPFYLFPSQDVTSGIPLSPYPVKEAIKGGAKIIRFENERDLSDVLSDIYLVAQGNESQIKSADPITRDADGNVIPLSKRFNPESSDIRFALPASRSSMPLDKARAHVFNKLRYSPRKVRVIAEPALVFAGRYDPDGTIVLNASHLSSIEDLNETLHNHENLHDAMETDPAVKRDGENLFRILSKEEQDDIEAAIYQYKERGASREELNAERAVEAIRKLTANRPDLRSAWGRLVESVSLKLKKMFGGDVTRQQAELVAARIVARGLKRLRKGKTGGRVGGGGSLYSKTPTSSDTYVPSQDPTARTRQRRVLAGDLNPPTGTEVLGTVNPDGSMKDVLLGEDGKPVYVATSGILDKETAERIIEASVPLIESIGLETVADILMNPQRLLDNGIVPNSALHQGVAMEAQFQANQRYLKDPKNPANQSLYDKTHNARERVGTEGGQSQGIRGALIGDERYQSMFITEALYDQIKKGLVRGFDTIMDAAEIATKIQEAVKRAEEAARADLDDMLTAVNPDISDEVDPSVYINTPAAQEKKTLAERMLEKDSPELLRLVNKIKGKVSWKEILGEPRQTMRERMAGIFDRVRKHEALQDLSPAEQETLTKELERLLQKQRLKQVNKDLQAAGLNLPKKAEKAVRDSMPELLRLINTGTFSAETFRDAVAPKFGLKTLSSGEVKRVEAIAAKINDAPAGMPKRQLQNELLTTMQDITSATKSQIALQYWVSSVLSGGRTQFDTAMSFLNGTRKFLQGASLAAMKGDGKVVGQAFQRYFKGLHDGMMEAAYYFRTGDPTMLLNFDAEMNAYLKGGQNEAHPYRLSEKIWKDAKESGNWLKIPPAAVIMSVNRMMQSWDHINARATSRGFLPLAVAFNRKLYSDLKVPDQADFKAAEQQAEQFLGKPKTWGEKVKVKAMANEILDASVSEDNKVRDTIINEAIDIGRTASYQNDPTGIIGTLYHGIKNTTANIIKKAEAAAQEAGKTAAKTGTKSDKAKATAMNLVAFSSRFVEPIAGTMFLRFVGNRFNELISLTPGLGAMRLWEKEMNQTKRAMIYTDQAVGSILYALGAVALYAMLSDDDDEDKRGWRIEGGWQGVDKAKQRQMLSEGRTPYSLAFKNADGSWGTLKFGNWPVASILATVGGMSDKAKYRPKEWNEDSYAAHIANAIFGGITAISDISAISALMETLGGTQYGKDPVEGLRDRVNATMANFTGGFIPRGLKDLDYLSNPAHNKPDDLMSFWLKEIPVYRRSVGAPMMDVFGRQVQLRREPWSRAYLPGPIEPEYQIAGRMASRGLFLPLSDPDQRVVGKGKNRRSMTDEEKGQYLKEAGEAYKDFVLRYGEKVLDMEPEKAREFIASKLTEARNRAEQRAVR